MQGMELIRWTARCRRAKLRIAVLDGAALALGEGKTSRPGWHCSAKPGLTAHMETAMREAKADNITNLPKTQPTLSALDQGLAVAALWRRHNRADTAACRAA